MKQAKKENVIKWFSDVIGVRICQVERVFLSSQPKVCLILLGYKDNKSTLEEPETPVTLFVTILCHFLCDYSFSGYFDYRSMVSLVEDCTE